MEEKKKFGMNKEEARTGVRGGNHKYTNPEAIRLWGKACNYHRGRDMSHICGNPSACERTLSAAFAAELCGWGLR